MLKDRDKFSATTQMNIVCIVQTLFKQFYELCSEDELKHSYS